MTSIVSSVRFTFFVSSFRVLHSSDRSHVILADFYTSQNNSTAAQTHTQAAATLHEAILDIFWDPSKLAFYDFNTTSNARNALFSAATFYPLWNGIVPGELLSSRQNAIGFFSAVNMVLNRYNGTMPVTFLETGLQWYVTVFVR